MPFMRLPTLQYSRFACSLHCVSLYRFRLAYIDVMWFDYLLYPQLSKHFAYSAGHASLLPPTHNWNTALNSWKCW